MAKHLELITRRVKPLLDAKLTNHTRPPQPMRAIALKAFFPARCSFILTIVGPGPGNGARVARVFELR